MRTGVLLMAHGTPSSLDEMPEYLTLVRGGRPPSPELVEEMRHNYSAIGGRSPLTDLTLAQAAALRARLGADVPVAVGMRNWQPFIKDAHRGARRAAASTRIIGIPMAPQFSTLSVQKYVDAATAALPAGVTFEPVRRFTRIRCCSTRSPSGCAPRRRGRDELVVFTAHACRARHRRRRRLRRRSGRDRARRGRARRRRAIRSSRIRAPAGRRSRGSARSSAQVIDERAATGVRKFLVVPIGFVCDHTEILFDIDVQAAQTSRASSRRHAAADRVAEHVADLHRRCSRISCARG